VRNFEVVEDAGDDEVHQAGDAAGAAVESGALDVARDAYGHHRALALLAPGLAEDDLAGAGFDLEHVTFRVPGDLFQREPVNVFWEDAAEEVREWRESLRRGKDIFDRILKYRPDSDLARKAKACLAQTP
jgi:hypothetical protein